MSNNWSNNTCLLYSFIDYCHISFSKVQKTCWLIHTWPIHTWLRFCCKANLPNDVMFYTWYLSLEVIYAAIFCFLLTCESFDLIVILTVLVEYWHVSNQRNCSTSCQYIVSLLFTDLWTLNIYMAPSKYCMGIPICKHRRGILIIHTLPMVTYVWLQLDM